MSIFASATQATVPIPFDAPQTITIRKLTGKEVEAAQGAHATSVAEGRTRGWATNFRRLLDKGATNADAVKALADPLTGYDRFSIIRSGLIAWSYPEAITLPPASATSADVATRDALATRNTHIDDLDDEAADFIAREILRLTKPGLFLTEEAREAAQKELPAVASGA